MNRTNYRSLKNPSRLVDVKVRKQGADDLKYTYTDVKVIEDTSDLVGNKRVNLRDNKLAFNTPLSMLSVSELEEVLTKNGQPYVLAEVQWEEPAIVTRKGYVIFTPLPESKKKLANAKKESTRATRKTQSKESNAEVNTYPVLGAGVSPTRDLVSEGGYQISSKERCE